MTGLLDRDIAAITGGAADGFMLDVTKRESCRDIAGLVNEKFGPVSILVNNAGINRRNAITAFKHGVLGFTRALAVELGKEGVHVNAIEPGLIETPLDGQARANNPELVKIFLDHTPLGRAGKPADIVGPAVFLASDLSGYVPARL